VDTLLPDEWSTNTQVEEMTKLGKFQQGCFLALFFVACYLFLVLDIHKSEIWSNSLAAIQVYMLLFEIEAPRYLFQSRTSTDLTVLIFNIIVGNMFGCVSRRF
jgi:hypothetical protein